MQDTPHDTSQFKRFSLRITVGSPARRLPIMFLVFHTSSERLVLVGRPCAQHYICWNWGFWLPDRMFKVQPPFLGFRLVEHRARNPVW